MITFTSQLDYLLTVLAIAIISLRKLFIHNTFLFSTVSYYLFHILRSHLIAITSSHIPTRYCLLFYLFFHYYYKWSNACTTLSHVPYCFYYKWPLTCLCSRLFLFSSFYCSYIIKIYRGTLETAFVPV